MRDSSKILIACILLAISFLLAAVVIYQVEIDGRSLGFGYFNLAEGVLAMILLYVFYNKNIIKRPGTPFEYLLLIYFLLATAQLLHLLFPPPGVIYWFGILVTAMVLWGSKFYSGRTRLVLNVGIVIVLMAALKFSVIPYIYQNQDASWTVRVITWFSSAFIPFKFADYHPLAGANQLLAFLALLIYTSAIWLNWPHEEVIDEAQSALLKPGIEIGQEEVRKLEGSRERNTEVILGTQEQKISSGNLAVSEYEVQPKKRGILKSIIAFLVGIISVVYVVAPTFGLIEILPDNLPFIGNIDEAVAVVLLMKVLDYFGVSVPVFTSKGRK